MTCLHFWLQLFGPDLFLTSTTSLINSILCRSRSGVFPNSFCERKPLSFIFFMFGIIFDLFYSASCRYICIRRWGSRYGLRAWNTCYKIITRRERTRLPSSFSHRGGLFLAAVCCYLCERDYEFEITRGFNGTLMATTSSWLRPWNTRRTEPIVINSFNSPVTLFIRGCCQLSPRLWFTEGEGEGGLSVRSSNLRAQFSQREPLAGGRGGVTSPCVRR